jgi:hypothetical protein
MRARALYQVRRAAADTGRRQTPAGAIHTGRQNACGYGGPLATEGHGCGGTGEGRPLRATDKEEGKREGRPYINIMYNIMNTYIQPIFLDMITRCTRTILFISIRAQCEAVKVL